MSFSKTIYNPYVSNKEFHKYQKVTSKDQEIMQKYLNMKRIKRSIRNKCFVSLDKKND